MKERLKRREDEPSIDQDDPLALEFKEVGCFFERREFLLLRFISLELSCGMRGVSKEIS